ncbi:MAG: TolC family protein [Proteobacteria bacterium]|nr:TolC family protein [Pseudomonadota bacterium]
MSIFSCVRRLRAPCSQPSRNDGRRSIVIIALLAAALLPSPASAQATLSLTDAQRIAVERSRQLAAQDAAIVASKEMAAAAGQLPDPVLKLGIDNLPIDGEDRYSLTRDFMTMRRIGVMQEFTRDDKRKLKVQRFDRETERAVTEKAVAVAALQKDTAIAWLERYYLERMRVVVAAQAAETNLEIEAAEGAYRAGRGTQVDLFTARASRIALDDRLSELDRRIRDARTALARWVGAAAEAPLAGKSDFTKVGLTSHTLDQEIERHPEIALLARQVAMAETEAQIAKANKQADWSLELAYQQRGPAFSNMVSVGVSIPLQLDQKNRQNRDLAAKLALTERAKAQQEDMLRAHIAEIRAMLNAWENGHERIARYERELVPLAQDRTQAALAAYRGAKGDLNSVLAARRNEIEVRTQTLQLEMDTARIWAQLNFLVPDGPHEMPADASATSKEAK